MAERVEKLKHRPPTSAEQPANGRVCDCRSLSGFWTTDVLSRRHSQQNELSVGLCTCCVGEERLQQTETKLWGKGFSRGPSVCVNINIKYYWHLNNSLFKKMCLDMHFLWPSSGIFWTEQSGFLDPSVQLVVACCLLYIKVWFSTAGGKKTIVAGSYISNNCIN